MKILYAIQGTGNGHISRALEIVPALQKKANTDILVSASQWELCLPFPIKYRLHGLGFVFGKKGGIDFVNTYLKMNTKRFINEIKSLPVHKYDLVISDFEPVSAWACRLNKIPCVGLSNQAATLHPLAPRPKKIDSIGKLVLQRYAPTTRQYGFHFKKIDDNIFTPIIRQSIRKQLPINQGHFTVYLPSFDDLKIWKKLKSFPSCKFHIFSKRSKCTFHDKNISIFPLDNEHFVQSLRSAAGIITNAGFGTTAEALFLGKKLLIIPMKSQYEQHCNAAMLETMGVKALPGLKKEHLKEIDDWISNGSTIQVNYPDETMKILEKIMDENIGNSQYNEDPIDKNDIPGHIFNHSLSVR